MKQSWGFNSPSGPDKNWFHSATKRHLLYDRLCPNINKQILQQTGHGKIYKYLHDY